MKNSYKIIVQVTFKFFQTNGKCIQVFRRFYIISDFRTFSVLHGWIFHVLEKFGCMHAYNLQILYALLTREISS